MTTDSIDWFSIGIIGFIILFIGICTFKSYQWKDIRLAIYGCGPIVSIGSVYLVYFLKGYEINWKLYSLLYLHILLGAFLAYDRIVSIKSVQSLRTNHRAILDNTADGIIIIESNGNIVLANLSAENLFGYSDGELLNKSINILMPEQTARLHDSYIENFNKTRIPKIIGSGRDVIGKRKNQSEFPLYLAINEIIIHDKQYFIGSLHDLTEIKKAQSELEKEKNLISKILETAGALIIVLNHEGKIINFNKASQDLSGFSIDEAKNHFIWEFLLPGLEAKRMRKIIDSIKNRPMPSNFQAAIKTKSQETRLIQWSNTTILNSNSEVEYIIAIGLDISQKHKQKKELEFLSRRVIQVRDEERSRIAADIHDGLGQTLIGLKFLIHDLSHKLTGQVELKKIATQSLDQIDQAVREGRSISHNLSPLALQKIGLPHAIKSILQNQTLVSFNINMVPEHISAVFENCWDINLYRLIQEAITNVLKHSEAKNIEISSKIENKQLVIYIIDDGKGFDPEAKIIEEGIGLLLMKARANFIGGNLHIQSKNNTGTEIKVVIKY